MWKIALVALALCLACDSHSGRDNPNPNYATSLRQLAAKRALLQEQLKANRSQAIAAARKVLVAALRDEILPAWDGTRWAMNGTSTVPQQGEIACGYFVSTTLLHAGFDINRSLLAQQAATHITKSLVSSEPIWHTSDQPIDAFVKRLRGHGDGIYLIGLDSHVGFAIVDGNDTWFHHSSPALGVAREPAHLARVFVASRYREAAKLFDDEFVEAWITRRSIKTALPKAQGHSR